MCPSFLRPQCANCFTMIIWLIRLVWDHLLCILVCIGLLPNGNFKDGPAKSQLNGTVVMGRHSIPNWEISGFVEYIQSGHTQDDMIVAVPEGASAVRLGNDASIRQNIRVTRRAYYSITFSAARTCAQAEKLNVSVAADSGVLPVQTVYSSGGWDSYSWAFRAKHSAVWLAIHNPGVEEDPACGPVIDAIAIKTLQPPTKTKGNIASFPHGSEDSICSGMASPSDS